MKEEKVSTYRKILSSTAIFGGAQVLTIIINIIRGKLVASILHSTGIGISSILSNAAGSIQQFALMGLNISAVKDISQASTEDERVLTFTIRLVRRLVLLASVLGLIITILLSPLLSKISFKDISYQSYFLLLSLSIFFNVMGTGEMAVLQGLRRYKLLAFCSLVPPACGLLLSIPIYYIWGIDGIVPAMIVANAIYFIVIRLVSYRNNQPKEKKEKITLKVAWQKGHHIIQFGIVMTIGVFLGTFTTYALTAFISNTGSVNDVGFYQAGNTITMQYIGLIFTAMATDYYPHLSSLIKNSLTDAFHFVNQQTEIIVLIMTPLAMLIILTAPLVIRVLLTEEFMIIEQMVCFMGMASIFKALCFPMDYIAYAKGDKHYIFWVETIWGCCKTFTIMALCYYFFGLQGLGYGALITAAVDFLVCLVLIPWRYGFRLSSNSIRPIIIMTTMAIVCFAGSFIEQTIWKYAVMVTSTAICIVYSIRQLDRRIDVRLFLSNIKKRFTLRKQSDNKAT